MANEGNTKLYHLTNTTLQRIDEVSNINSPMRFTTMRVIVLANGKLGAITEEEAREKEEQMRTEANPQAVRSHA